MASDLSIIIQEGICNTLNVTLSKKASIKTINKIHPNDLKDIETLKVNSTFEFRDIVSTWSFIVPAYSASYIFNSMIGDNSEPLLKIDNDIADATNEFVSTVSKGLTTTINGNGLEDLGDVKCITSSEGVIQGDTLLDIDNIYKFTIDLDGIEIIILILFDNVIVPFIESICSSEITFYPEVIEEEKEKEEEKEVTPDIITEEKEEISSNTDEVNENISNENIIDNSDANDNKIEDEIIDPKSKKLKKIIIIVGALLGVTILTGVTFYFLGMFDPVPIVKAETNATQIVKDKNKVDIIQYNSVKKINFKPSQINTKRLNARLEILTKYEILNQTEIEAEKLAEKDRLLKLEKEKKLLAFAKLNKEEPLFSKPNKQDASTKINKLRFVVMSSLKYTLYKDMIFKTDTKQARISICQNTDGRTFVYIGPFENEIIQNQMIDLIKLSANNTPINSILLEQDEFDTRCNF